MPTTMTPARKTPAAVRARIEANSSGVMSGTAATIDWVTLSVDYHLYLIRDYLLRQNGRAEGAADSPTGPARRLD
jgi:hypothetical protein